MSLVLLCRVLGAGVCFVSLIFFFKQKTAYEMRISDWSSDVCSSDLARRRRACRPTRRARDAHAGATRPRDSRPADQAGDGSAAEAAAVRRRYRAGADRKSVV